LNKCWPKYGVIKRYIKRDVPNFTLTEFGGNQAFENDVKRCNSVDEKTCGSERYQAGCFWGEEEDALDSSSDCKLSELSMSIDAVGTLDETLYVGVRNRWLGGKSIIDAFQVSGCVLDKSSFTFENLDADSPTTFFRDGELSKVLLKGKAGTHRQFII